METTQPPKKEILKLLLADMRNRKLIMGLEAAGLSQEDFYTDLIDVILSKMGFPDPQDDELYTWYEHTLEYLVEKDIRYFRDKQEELASRMYNLLELKKHTMYPFGEIEKQRDIKKFFMGMKKLL